MLITKNRSLYVIGTDAESRRKCVSALLRKCSDLIEPSETGQALRSPQEMKSIAESHVGRRQAVALKAQQKCSPAFMKFLQINESIIAKIEKQIGVLQARLQTDADIDRAQVEKQISELEKQKAVLDIQGFLSRAEEQKQVAPQYPSLGELTRQVASQGPVTQVMDDIDDRQDLRIPEYSVFHQIIEEHRYKIGIWEVPTISNRLGSSLHPKTYTKGNGIIIVLSAEEILREILLLSQHGGRGFLNDHRDALTQTKLPLFFVIHHQTDARHLTSHEEEQITIALQESFGEQYQRHMICDLNNQAADVKDQTVEFIVGNTLPQSHREHRYERFHEEIRATRAEMQAAQPYSLAFFLPEGYENRPYRSYAVTEGTALFLLYMSCNPLFIAMAATITFGIVLDIFTRGHVNFAVCLPVAMGIEASRASISSITACAS